MKYTSLPFASAETASVIFRADVVSAIQALPQLPDGLTVGFLTHVVDATTPLVLKAVAQMKREISSARPTLYFEDTATRELFLPPAECVRYGEPFDGAIQTARKQVTTIIATGINTLDLDPRYPIVTRAEARNVWKTLRGTERT